jgi:hypothetical protein
VAALSDPPPDELSVSAIVIVNNAGFQVISPMRE